MNNALYILAVQVHPANGLTKASANLATEIIDLTKPTAKPRVVGVKPGDSTVSFLADEGTKMYTEDGHQVVDLDTGVVAPITLSYKDHPVDQVFGVLADGSPIWQDNSSEGSFHAGKVNISADTDLIGYRISAQPDFTSAYVKIKVSPTDSNPVAPNFDVYVIATGAKIAAKVSAAGSTDGFTMSANGKYGISGDTAFVSAGKSYVYPDTSTTTGVKFWAVTDDGIAYGDTASVNLKTGLVKVGPTVDPDGNTIDPKIFGQFWINRDKSLWFNGVRLSS